MNPRILQLKTFIINMLPHFPEGLEKLHAATSPAFVVPVMSFGYPIQRALRILSGHIEMFQPEHYHTRSQELETAYHNAGQWCLMRVNAMFDAIPVSSPAANAVVVSDMDAQDIDTEEDWLLAGLKFQLRLQTS